MLQKNKVVLVFYIQIKFILKFTHLHVFIAQRNLLSGRTLIYVSVHTSLLCMSMTSCWSILIGTQCVSSNFRFPIFDKTLKNLHRRDGARRLRRAKTVFEFSDDDLTRRKKRTSPPVDNYVAVTRSRLPWVSGKR